MSDIKNIYSNWFAKQFAIISLAEQAAKMQIMADEDARIFKILDEISGVVENRIYY